MIPLPPSYTLFPYTTLFRSVDPVRQATVDRVDPDAERLRARLVHLLGRRRDQQEPGPEREQPAQVRAERAVELRSEEHTSELQSRFELVCRLLLEKKKLASLQPATKESLHAAFVHTDHHPRHQASALHVVLRDTSPCRLMLNFDHLDGGLAHASGH